MRKKFPLDSNQLELLLAFNEAGSLSELANLMNKDISVVSRGLQKLAQDYPAIEKSNNRYVITALGKKVIDLTDNFLNELESVDVPNTKKDGILIIINAQKFLSVNNQPTRNNLSAEENIKNLMDYFRKKKLPIIYIKHISEKVESPFYPQNSTCEFMDFIKPINGEIVLDKKFSSAFKETNLETLLEEYQNRTIYLAGFTAFECIDATAREGSGLGFEMTVIEDACAMYDVNGVDGKLYKADRIQKLTMENLRALYAKVLLTNNIIN